MLRDLALIRALTGRRPIAEYGRKGTISARRPKPAAGVGFIATWTPRRESGRGRQTDRARGYDGRDLVRPDARKPSSVQERPHCRADGHDIVTASGQTRSGHDKAGVA